MIGRPRATRSSAAAWRHAVTEFGEAEARQPAVQDAVGVEHLSVTDEMNLACYHAPQSTEALCLEFTERRVGRRSNGPFGR